MGIKENAGLTVISGAEASSDDDGQLGDVSARDCADHLGTVLGNAAFLRLGSDHVTGDVHEEEQRDLALRAQLDEVGRLERRRREEYAVVRYDTHGEAVDVCEPLHRCQLPQNTKVQCGDPGREEKGANRHDGLPVFLLELAEAAPIYQSRDHLPHVEWLAEVRADYPVQLVRRIERILWDSRGL
jgi:hypothetical protein